ncbi:Tagatose-6-phosphate kinase [Paraliobacillus sp. PM-2]|uniref:1-phosphofructokinase n=1 Tax=Paraliobacillus sp. PM-2 TaxID=1462524 RepID=UPI00061BD229|nr:1-phosphofructokinase [Paraliobacillus sp. PM-2]CQR46257.1 Tagatose-6-phosphate kinase [Paraliobacillus sp. PM-2]
MIYTLTPNPAIDLYVGLEQLKADTVNRTYEEDYQPNGKAINVSFMLKRLGLANTALGFLGGFSGKFIEDELEKMEINTSFVHIDGITRINIFANADKEYKIVNKGPEVQSEKVKEMLEKINKLPEKSILFVSGSLPSGVSDNFCIEVAKICNKKQIKLVLDISSKVLMDCLNYQPHLIKPNDEELAIFFDLDISEMTESKIIECSNILLEKGAKQVLVSRGEKGAIYVTHDNLLKVTSPKGVVVNTACAGDAMLSGFIGKLEQGYSLEKALRFASAAGAATAFSKGLGELSYIESLVSETKISNLKEEKVNG